MEGTWSEIVIHQEVLALGKLLQKLGSQTITLEGFPFVPDSQMTTR